MAVREHLENLKCPSQHSSSAKMVTGRTSCLILLSLLTFVCINFVLLHPVYATTTTSESYNQQHVGQTKQDVTTATHVKTTSPTLNPMKSMVNWFNSLWGGDDMYKDELNDDVFTDDNETSDKSSSDNKLSGEPSNGRDRNQKGSLGFKVNNGYHHVPTHDQDSLPSAPDANSHIKSSHHHETTAPLQILKHRKKSPSKLDESHFDDEDFAGSEWMQDDDNHDDDDDGDNDSHQDDSSESNDDQPLVISDGRIQPTRVVIYGMSQTDHQKSIPYRISHRKSRKHNRRHADHDSFYSTPVLYPKVPLSTVIYGSGDGPLPIDEDTDDTEHHEYHNHHNHEHIQSSVVISPSLTSVSVDIESSSQMNSADDLLYLTRIVPSLSSPTYFGSTTLLPEDSLSSKSIYNRVSGGGSRKKWTNIYSTPTLNPIQPGPHDPEEDDDDDLDAYKRIPLATPVFPSTSPTVISFTVSTSTSYTPVSSLDLVSATPTFKFVKPSDVPKGTGTKENEIVTDSEDEDEDDDDEDDDDDETDEESEGSSSKIETTTSKGDSPPGVPPTTDANRSKGSEKIHPTQPNVVFQNNPPVVKRRIPKLSVTSGQWYKYRIPEMTFYDEEDGYTRNLKLGFYLSGGSFSGKAPTSDDWIQFDTENQFIFALPTEDKIGKHEFILMAIDSSGLMTEEIITVHVRQHRASRNFNHMFVLHDVTWDPIKYPVLIEATERLLHKIASMIYGDSSITTFVLQDIRVESAKESYRISWTNESIQSYPCPKTEITDYYSRLADLKKPMTSSGVMIEPSRHLRKILGQEFRIKAVSLKLMGSCSGSGSSSGFTDPSSGGSSASSPVNPELRNEMDLIQIHMGHVYRHQIREDMFYSPKGGDTRELELTLLTIDGKTLPPDGPIGFHSDRQEIYALPLDFDDESHTVGISSESYASRRHKIAASAKRKGSSLKHEKLGPQEYMLIARDVETGATASDAFMVEFLRDDSDNSYKNGFEVIMSIAPLTESELDLETRVSLMWKIGTSLLTDNDPSSLKVLRFKKSKYSPNFHQHQSHLTSHNTMIIDDQGSDHSSSGSTRNMKRELPPKGYNSNSGINMNSHNDNHKVTTDDEDEGNSNNNFNRQEDDDHHATFYEIIWTNRSISLNDDFDENKCPIDLINDNIISRIFSSSHLTSSSSTSGIINNNHHEKKVDFDSVSKHFDPDFKLLHVSFRPVGHCVSQLSSYNLGEEPMEIILKSTDHMRPDGDVISSTTSERPSVKTSASDNFDSEESEREYYMTAILPALITISVMLIIALIIVCLLVKYRRSQEKTVMNSMTTTAIMRGGGTEFMYGGAGERDTFLTKGGRAPVIFEQEMQQQALLASQNPAQTPYGFGGYTPVILPPAPSQSTSYHHMTPSASSQHTTPHHVLGGHHPQASSTPVSHQQFHQV